MTGSVAGGEAGDLLYSVELETGRPEAIPHRRVASDAKLALEEEVGEGGYAGTL